MMNSSQLSTEVEPSFSRLCVSDPTEHAQFVSPVLHLRQLPCDVTEQEVVSLALPFGPVSKLVHLRSKGQAFVEMSSEDSAVAMVTYYASAPPTLRNQPIYIQHSHHRELKTHTQSASAAAAAAAVHSGGLMMSPEGRGLAHSPVLRIIVENLFYPVTLEVLQQIFSKFGQVLKIITFTRNNQFQALIQFSDTMHAQHAKTSLDGQNIYNGCCSLKVDFSRLTSLNVKYNNDKSRDFTRHDLPSGDAYGVSVPHYGATAFHAPFHQHTGLAMQIPPIGHSVLLVSNLNPEKVSPQCLFILFGVYGDVQRVKILFNKKENALVQMSDATQAQLAMSHLNGQRLHGNVLRVTLSKHACVQLPRSSSSSSSSSSSVATGAAAMATTGAGSGVGLGAGLNHCPVAAGDDLTRDYSGSALHRFKKPGSKNYSNIYPPSATLHLSNVPESVSEEDLKDLFSSSGFTVKGFKFFQKDRKMALIQLDSVEEAIEALILLHDRELEQNGPQNQHLRVSFSKSNI